MCAFSYACILFCSCDFDLDPMTLTYERDLERDLPKTYLCTENEVSRSMFSKVKSTNSTDSGQCMCRGLYRLNYIVLSCRLNALNCVSSRTSRGKLFHTRGPATEKLLSPKVVCVHSILDNVL